MKFLNKLFSGKNQSDEEAVLKMQQSLNQKDFNEVSYRIYPYFKQFLPSADRTYPLPADLSKTDKEKTYELPEEFRIVSRIYTDRPVRLSSAVRTERIKPSNRI